MVDKTIDTTIYNFGLHDLRSVRYHFSGHETFPFRYTWLPKGVQKLEKYPDLFTCEDAIVILGVGKNMVVSIRHWCETLRLIEPLERGKYRTTELGQFLFGYSGCDPYLENPGTLWLLHWILASRLERASTWCLAFTRWSAEEFSRDQLVDWIWKIKAESPTTRATISSIRRDIEVFLRTYVPSKVTNTIPLEDTFDCPLVELGLISEIGHSTYQFVRGQKTSLPEEIFLFAVLDFWNTYAPQQNSLSFETLMHAIGSPGGVFKLTENALVERLETLPELAQLNYSETAGRRGVFRLGTEKTNAIEILKSYYIHVPKDAVNEE